MAGSASRLGAKALPRNCRCWNFSESRLSGNVWPVLGGTDGGVGNQGFGVESLRRATFDASSRDQHSLIRLENYTIKLLPGRNFALSTSGALSSQSPYGSLGFGWTCRSHSTSPGRRPIMRSAADGSQKVVARIANVPKFPFKSDLLWLLKGCNLTAEDFLYIYDSKYRLKFIEIQLPSLESFQQAQKSLASKGRFGARYLKLTSEEFEMDEVNKVLEPYRGRSLIIPNVGFNVMTDDVERFFSGYALDSNYAIKFVRSRVQFPVAANRGPMAPTRTEIVQRALIRFRTELEALRALREKQGAICVDKPTDLRFIS